MPAAARATDNHTCTMTNPNGSPHNGGPIINGVSTVLIGGLPAATVNSKCTCAGPPDTIQVGSSSVKIGGQDAARQNDTTQHGGRITGGLSSVIIGG